MKIFKKFLAQIKTLLINAGFCSGCGRKLAKLPRTPHSATVDLCRCHCGKRFLLDKLARKYVEIEF